MRTALFHLGVLPHSGLPTFLNGERERSNNPSRMAAATMKGMLIARSVPSTSADGIRTEFRDN
jgi:hypothetical protein